MRKMFSKNQILKVIEKESEENGIQIFSNIEDQDAHNRFIEGDINLVDGLTGFTKIYGKWSLSGTHLMFVLALKIDNATTYSSKVIATANIPDWIKVKIVPIFSTQVIPYVPFTAGNADGTSSQTINYSLRKSAQDDIQIFAQGITTTADRYVRCQLDLLIDNE